MNCNICNATNSVKEWFEKEGYVYHYCISCNSLFTLEPLPNDNMVGGGMELERNEQQNKCRIERIKKLKQVPFVLDFGCGHGMLVDDLLEEKINAIGYDKFNIDYEYLPNVKVDIVTMIEVIEHLSFPFIELDIVHSLLRREGILYLETSFTDIAKRLDINLKDWTYVSPLVGHSTIFSHKGLDTLMIQKGFTPLEHINENVRLYHKI